MRKLGILFSLLLLACTPDKVVQPLVNVTSRENSYLVKFTDDVKDPKGIAAGLVNQNGGQLRYVYSHSMKGFAAELSDAAVEALWRNPNVENIEPDAMVRLVEPKGVTIAALESSWGLDRIDQRNVDLNGQYNPPNDGSGVTVYVIDTGIWTTHIDFTGRASWGPDFSGSYLNYDCNGHGTHVAGTIGGVYYGVAKAVNLVSVRVFDCSGSAAFSTVIAAVDWVTANAVKPAVVNMSLGGPYTQILNDAVTASIASGVVYSVSAGNENTDACNVSPASTPTALTVGAIALDDRRSAFSNQGPCVDLFAPGEDIWSDWTGRDQWYVYLCGNSCVMNLSGTSMASPHVAGVAAQVLSRNPTATAVQVHDAIVSQATTGTLWYNLMPGTPSRVLYATQDLTGGGSEPPPPAPPPPTVSADFSATCAKFTCTFTALNAGGWDFGDGTTVFDQNPPVAILHTFLSKRKYTVFHQVGNLVAYRLINCTPKKCQVQ